MRKTITIMLAAATLAGLAAQPAAADDPQATIETTRNDAYSTVTQICKTPDRWGINGQYGAWGNYVDGCTVKLRCENADSCVVRAATGSLISRVGDPPAASYEQTCNVRVRVFASNGAFMWHRDGNSRTVGANDYWYDYFGGRHDIARCSASALYKPSWYPTTIRRGEWATVQANGVRSNHWNPPARVQAAVTLG